MMVDLQELIHLQADLVVKQRKYSELKKILLKDYPSKKEICIQRLNYVAKKIDTNLFFEFVETFFAYDVKYSQMYDGHYPCDDIGDIWIYKSYYSYYTKSIDLRMFITKKMDMDVSYTEEEFYHIDDEDLQKNFYEQHHKVFAARKIQRSIRRWLAQPYYKSGRPGLVMRQRKESFTNSANAITKKCV